MIIKMASILPPFYLCTFCDMALQHLPIRDGIYYPPFEYGWHYDLLWPTERGRSGIGQVLHLGLRKLCASHSYNVNEVC